MHTSQLLKKIIMLGLSVTLLFTMLTGCTSKTSDAGEAGAGSSAATTAAAFDKVEIEFYQMKPEAIDIYNEIIAKFEAENPSIKVNQNNVPDPKTVLQTRLASNDAPDVMLAYPNETEFKVYVSEGYMMDLTGSDALKTVAPTILDSIKIDGKDYSLPLSVNTTGVFYNKKLFADNNISIPTTYDEFIAACEKLKTTGVTPMVFSDKDAWTAGILANLMLGMEMGKPQADAFFADVIAGTQKVPDNATIGMIADHLIQLRQYGPADAAGIGYDQAIAMFANGEAAMYFNGIWANPSMVKANPNLDYGMFPFPGTSADKTVVIYGIDSAFSVSAITKHPEESLKFLEFLSRPETAQFFADKDNSPSCITGVTVKLPAVQDLAKLLSENKSFQWMHFMWPAGMEGTFNSNIQMLVTTMDKPAFLDQMNADFVAAGQK